jgi:glutathione synthase/RimK-type ligase-like ATP-grasp enzyme
MLLAIHPHPGSYSDHWIATCRQREIPIRLVDCWKSDIIDQLRGADALLWHWSHGSVEDQLVARQVIAAAEYLKLAVYPNSITSWHFDDKIAQKYLLEAVAAPLIPSRIFLKEEDAFKWLEEASFPQVFKLRCGAGSVNVRLVKNKSEAARLCRKMFSRGIPSYSSGFFADFQTKIHKTKDFKHFLEKAKRAFKTIRSISRARRTLPRQKNYALFQDFLPNNECDTRVSVIGRRAFAFQRFNRPGDFRASGSGRIGYDPEKIDRRCLQIAFQTSSKIDAQCMAYDFLFDAAKEPCICEISYGFMAQAVYDCPGYWDERLNWHEGHHWPQDLILDDILVAIREKNEDHRPKA